MEENRDDPLSSEDRIRRAKEGLGGPRPDVPDAESREGPPPGPFEEDDPFGSSETSEAPPPPDYERVERQSAADYLKSHPPEPPPEPWYKQGWVRLLGIGAVGLALFLFNNGWGFSGPPEERFLDGFEEAALDGGLTESSWECIEEGLRADGYVTELAAIDDSTWEELDRLPDDAPVSAWPPELQHFTEGVYFYMTDPSSGCLSPVEIANLPTDFSDPASVALVAILRPGCEEGAFSDCDMLWMVTDVGSPDEQVALTCGGRNEPLDFSITSCILNYQSESSVQVIADECRDGFYLACDLLFSVSTVGSEDAALGASCGGQRPAEYLIPCNTAYGYGTRD